MANLNDLFSDSLKNTFRSFRLSAFGYVTIYYSLCRFFNIIQYILTCILTYSMVHSPSSEANWFAASQEIPRILWNPKVHYRTHKRPTPVVILGQPNPVHIPTSHLLEIPPNIIHPSTTRSPQWSLSLRFPHQEPIRPPPLTHKRAGLTTPPCKTALLRNTNMQDASSGDKTIR